MENRVMLVIPEGEIEVAAAHPRHQPRCDVFSAVVGNALRAAIAFKLGRFVPKKV